MKLKRKFMAFLRDQRGDTNFVSIIVLLILIVAAAALFGPYLARLF